MHDGLSRYVTLGLIAWILTQGLLAAAVEPDSSPTTSPVARATLDEVLRRQKLDTAFHECLSVADGDTLVLDQIGTVRLIGVDTPEKGRVGLPVEFLAQEAGVFTRGLCLGRRIRLEYDLLDNDLRDKYGRALGYAFLEDGTFVQEQLLRKGYSIAYVKYPFDPARKAQFLEWEAEARRAGVGLWEDGGFAEVRWLAARQYPEISVFGMAHKKWGLRYGGFVLPRVEESQLESRTRELYTWIHEYSPKDLKKTLLENGYREETKETAK